MFLFQRQNCSYLIQSWFFTKFDLTKCVNCYFISPESFLDRILDVSLHPFDPRKNMMQITMALWVSRGFEILSRSCILKLKHHRKLPIKSCAYIFNDFLFEYFESWFSTNNHEPRGNFFGRDLEAEVQNEYLFGSTCFTLNVKLPPFSHVVQGREELQKMLKDYSKHRYNSDVQPTEEDSEQWPRERDFKMFLTEKWAFFYLKGIQPRDWKQHCLVVRCQLEATTRFDWLPVWDHQFGVLLALDSYVPHPFPKQWG